MPSETSQTDRNFYKTCSRTCPWERIPTSGCLNSQEKMACSPFASRRLGRDTAKTDSGGTTSEDCVLKMSIQITKHFCKPSCKSSTEGQINNKAHSSQLLFFPGKIKRKGYALCSFLTKLRLCMFVRFSVSNSQSSSTIILYHSTTSSSQKKLSNRTPHTATAKRLKRTNVSVRNARDVALKHTHLVRVEALARLRRHDHVRNAVQAVLQLERVARHARHLLLRDRHNLLAVSRELILHRRSLRHVVDSLQANNRVRGPNHHHDIRVVNQTAGAVEALERNHATDDFRARRLVHCITPLIRESRVRALA
mmetsp:Transcript_11835/g.31359  ORF Transcript_11835/g.31359 Transcript_11835/m.31359 type:complete len:309 (-) Transcript_11835:1330-2256(-)